MPGRQAKVEVLPNPPSAAVGSLRTAYWVVGAVAISAVIAWLQFSITSVCCGDFDGYYHIKWSRLLWEGLRHGHLPAFTWLPLTTLNAARYADQHFLYHVLLIPFTWFGDLRLGAKVGTAFFASLAVFSLYWLVLRYRIRYPLMWLLALLGCSWMFYVRVSMTRASGISILFIVAGIVLLLDRKYVWLAPAAFLYVWTYNLFVMLGVLVVVWVVVMAWTERRIEWRPVLWTCVGTAAGFVIHPYFPRNAKLFFEHLASKSGAANAQAVVGFEWYALPSWEFLNSAMVACAAMVIGYVAFGYALSLNHDRGRDRARLHQASMFLLFSSFLLLATLRFVRFMEYWPPFAVLFAAFALQAVWEGRAQATSSEGTTEAPQNSGESVSWGWVVVAVALLAAALTYNLHATRATIRSATKDADHYQAAANWMMANIPADALIYDINWSDFPKLFFYDTTHRYVSGLDPIYLLDVHPELGQLNDRLSHRMETDPAGAISTQFAAADASGVSYIFVGDYPVPPPPEWFAYMMKSGRFASLYHDSECTILQVLSHPQSEAGEAAADEVRHMDSPEQRKQLLPEVHRRFGADVFATDEEGMGPALVIHNAQANAEWAKRLFMNDANSISGELLWQLGYRLYIVTDGKNKWIMEVKGNPKFRSNFANPSPAASK